VKSANDVLLAKEEMVLQSTIDRLIEIGRHYGMEMNVEKVKVVKISKEPSTVQIMVDQKPVENVEYFNCLGNVITNNAKFT
jgi:hypothetical protein